VLKKMAEVGESVAPIPPGVNISTSSGAIVALADLATLEVETDVAEANVAKLRQDQPAEVTVEAFPDRRFAARLRQIIPTADRTKATVQVKVTILESDPFLKPEMSAKVTFIEPEAERETEVEPTQVVVVPRSAIVTRGGESVAFVVQTSTARMRRLVTAGERDGQVVIREGLSGGERLVDAPQESLADGDEVRVEQ
jgi:RND family efflux transporter MFP subunit